MSKIQQAIDKTKSEIEESKIVLTSMGWAPVSVMGAEIQLKCAEKYLKQLLEIQKEQDNLLIAENQELKENIQWFIDRCKKGEVRSTRTFAVFTNLLDKYK